MEEIDIILEEIFKEKINYKGLDILKYLLKNNLAFTKLFIKYLQDGKIKPFSYEEFEIIQKQNIRGIDNFETVFKNGLNLGRCTVTSKQLSYSYDNVALCSGIMEYLKGTQNSINGEHCWMEYNNYIYDTTLMLKIDKSLALLLGYKEENKISYDQLMSNHNYKATKDYTNDKDLKSL